MKTFSRLFIFAVFFVVQARAFGQQIPLFNQYYVQPALIYSSASVMADNPQLSVLYRGQLSGLDGAPVTFGLNYSNPLWNELGYSVNVNSHELGILRQTTLSAGLSRMLMMKAHKLSFGVEAGVALFSIDEDRVSVESLTDELIQNILGNNGSSAFIAASVSYRFKDFSAHLAMPNLLHSSLSDGDFDQLSRANRPDFSASANYDIAIDPIKNIRFSPQLTYRHYSVIGGAMDITGRLEINNKFQLNAGYREGFGSTAGIGVEIRPGLLFTYQYDFGKSDIPFLSDGFNELGLHLRFKSKKELETETYKAGEEVIDRLQEKEIYDKKLISEKDQSSAIGYLSSLETGGRKTRKAKGEQAFDRVLDEIKAKGLARMQAEADQRKSDAERSAAERAEAELEESRQALEKSRREKAALEEEVARLKAASETSEKMQAPETVQTPEPQAAFEGDYIVVVGSFSPDSDNAEKFYDSLKEKYPEGGIFRSKKRGYDYVYVMHFAEKAKAVSAMRELRKQSQFSDSWVHILRLSR
ncbi:MAG: hypothetical protein Roseis2KO_57890 [Roseivirga sp.]